MTTIDSQMRCLLQSVESDRGPDRCGRHRCGHGVQRGGNVPGASAVQHQRRLRQPQAAGLECRIQAQFEGADRIARRRGFTREDLDAFADGRSSVRPPRGRTVDSTARSSP